MLLKSGFWAQNFLKDVIGATPQLGILLTTVLIKRKQELYH